MTMPAGSYYVGDLCYVMTDDEWTEFCELTINGSVCLDGEFTLADGRRFASYSTAYGDGEYPDQLGNSYPVDAGLIGCIRLVDIGEDFRDRIVPDKLGAIIDFPDDFVTSSNEETDEIQIGHVVIQTADYNMPEEVDYDGEY